MSKPFFRPREGSEKLRELEEIMHGSGAFTENFTLGLGDLMEIEDENNTGVPAPGGDGDSGKPINKRKADPFPTVEGSESCGDFVNKYKKACLNRRAVFKELVDKWETAKVKGGKCPDGVGHSHPSTSAYIYKYIHNINIYTCMLFFNYNNRTVHSKKVFHAIQIPETVFPFSFFWVMCLCTHAREEWDALTKTVRGLDKATAETCDKYVYI